MFDLENFPKSRSAKEMLSYVTRGWYDKSYIGKWLYEFMGMELDTASEYIKTFPEQLFPETATWGLRFHEDKYGLPVREDLPIEERRMRIFKKRDLRSPMTPSRMEEYLTNAAGIEVHVADCNDPGELGYVPVHPNVFKVMFVTEDTLDMPKLRNLLDGLKQSHTSCVICDWVKVVMDYREMEKFLLKNILLRMQIPFLELLLPDGIESYAPKMRLACRGIGIAAEESMDITGILLMSKCHVPEEMKCIRTAHRYGFSCMELLRPGTETQRIRVAVCINTQTERIDVGVSVVRKNSWRFDGKILMDGSRKFNSFFEEEVL